MKPHTHRNPKQRNAGSPNGAKLPKRQQASRRAERTKDRQHSNDIISEWEDEEMEHSLLVQANQRHRQIALRTLLDKHTEAIMQAEENDKIALRIEEHPRLSTGNAAAYREQADGFYEQASKTLREAKNLVGSDPDPEAINDFEIIFGVKFDV